MNCNNDSLVESAHSQRGATTPNSILDSKHIVATSGSLYDIKIVDCGEYSQVYLYENKKFKRTIEKDNELELKKYKINKMFDNSCIDKKTKIKNYDNSIESRSIIRSKLECQRLAKANINEWETFITLTFKDNITDLDFAHKRFKYFIDKVRRVKKDFKFLCITEFQKRGATHYHLLCNIPVNSNIIPKRPILKLWNNDLNSYKELEYYDIKYWNDGFSSAEEIKDDPKKVIGYISKYMTKDIDNRLFNRHRYLYSRNLNVPQANFINLDKEKDYNFYIKKIQGKDLIYQTEYVNPYDNTKVTFLEFSNKS